MPLRSEQGSPAAPPRLRRVALACALAVLATLVPAASATAGPVLAADPTLSRAGRTLTTDNGSWIPAQNTYSYGWQRCDATAATCVDVPGRTGNTYLLTTADISTRIRSVVAATSLLGTTTAPSAATTLISAAPPLNTKPPVVTGRGTTLSATLGDWSDPSPTSVIYTRQWQRCSGANALSCQNVSGRVGATYPLTAADQGKFIRVVVSAEGLGKASVGTAPLGPFGPLGGGGGGNGGGGGSNGDPVAALRKLRPFPKVIIVGEVIKSGRFRKVTRISGLAIRGGPKGASVSVSCRGRGCPRGGTFRAKLNRAGGLGLKRYQRIYRAEAVIEIRITRRGAIGKFTRLRVRAGGIPTRRNACLMPGASRPRRCP